MRTRMNISQSIKKLFSLAVCTTFIGLIGCSWKSYIPNELKSSGSIEMIYEADGTHWVGPRGINEAFIVYSVPDKALQALKNEGLEYLENLQTTKTYENLYRTYEALTVEKQIESSLDARGLYKDWRATPVQINEERWNRQRNNEFNALVRKGLSAEQRWKRYRTKYSKHDTRCNDTSLCSFYGDYKSIPPYFKNNKTLRERSLDDLNFVDDIKPEYVELVVKILKSPNSYFGFGESGVIIVSPEHNKLFLLYRD